MQFSLFDSLDSLTPCQLMSSLGSSLEKAKHLQHFEFGARGGFDPQRVKFAIPLRDILLTTKSQTLQKISIQRYARDGPVWTVRLDCVVCRVTVAVSDVLSS